MPKPIIRTRTDYNANYYAIFANGETLRFYIDENKPMLAPRYPELYDVSINNKCHGGCSYCYASAKRSGKNYEDIVKKAYEFFGPLGNDAPFQIAVGGAGEPTEHPDFTRFMEAVRSMNIMPNYTTNGMNINDDIIECAVNTCGGVAVSAHLHLEGIWRHTIRMYHDAGALTNMHIVIGAPGSFDDMLRLYAEYNDCVKHFVLLPYIPQGRAKELPSIQDEWDTLFEWLVERDNINRFAFGAYFFDQIEKFHIPAYTYEPHMFSSYLDMDKMEIYESSFHGTVQNDS